MQFESKRRLKMLCALLALGGCYGVASADEVTDRAKNPDLWAAPGGDQAQTRHSSLKLINKDNVKGLQMVWSHANDVHGERLAQHHSGIGPDRS